MMTAKKGNRSIPGRRTRAMTRKEESLGKPKEPQGSQNEFKIAGIASKTDRQRRGVSKRTPVNKMFSAQHVVETSARPLAKRSDNLWPDLKKSKPSQPTPNAKPVPPAKMQCADDEMPIPKPGKRVLEMAEENVETVARKKRKCEEREEGLGPKRQNVLVSREKPLEKYIPIRNKDLDDWLDAVVANRPEGTSSGTLGGLQPDTNALSSPSSTVESSTATTYISEASSPKWFDSADTDHPSYRADTLGTNGIEIRSSRKSFPPEVRDHVFATRTGQPFPEVSINQMDAWLDELDRLQRSATEEHLKAFITKVILPDDSDPAYGLPVTSVTGEGAMMLPHLIPKNADSPFYLRPPLPNMLYGYSGHRADGGFTSSQLITQTVMKRGEKRFPQATCCGLRFPFLTIETKDAGSRKGDHWVAANECAGASAACVNAVERLNSLLKEHKSTHRVDGIVYSLAVDINVAMLYVSWQDDEKEGGMYNLQLAGTFLLSRPDDLERLRRQMRNIMDWAREKRLRQIQDALDILAEKLTLGQKHEGGRKDSMYSVYSLE